MNKSTRTSTKKNVLVTITPYTEQDKRILLTNGSSNNSNLTNSTINENKTIPNATNNGTINNTSYNNNNNNTTSSIIPPAPAQPISAAPPPAPPAPPLPLPTKTGATNNEDSVEMQSIESFKLKESPNPVIPKPPSTYFPLSNSSSPAATSNGGSPRHVPMGNKTTTTSQIIKEKDHHQLVNQSTNETNKNSTTTTTTTTTNNNNTTNISNAISPNGNTGGIPKPPVGKVAIRIGAYEGEAKQPAKLDFLAQQPRTEKNGTEEANGPVVSRLQNELAATLQRSNLRKKTEGENQTTAKSILPSDNTMMTTMLEKETTNNPEPNKLPQSTVEKLATALGNKVTIRVNPDDGGNR